MQSTVKQSHKRSPLQSVKDNWRGYLTSNNNFLPTSIEQVDELHNRQLALNFLNNKMNNHSSRYTKTQFCREHRVSHNTLNKGLETLGIKTKHKQHPSRTDANFPNQSPNKTIQDNSRQKKKTGSSRDITAGSQKEFVGENQYNPIENEIELFSPSIPQKSSYYSNREDLNTSSKKLFGKTADEFQLDADKHFSQNRTR